MGHQIGIPECNAIDDRTSLDRMRSLWRFMPTEYVSEDSTYPVMAPKVDLTAAELASQLFDVVGSPLEAVKSQILVWWYTWGFSTAETHEIRTYDAEFERQKAWNLIAPSH